MNKFYLYFLLICLSLSAGLSAESLMTCKITKGLDGKPKKDLGCLVPLLVDRIEIDPGLGQIDLLAFLDLRDVTVRLGEGSYPLLYSHTLVSAGTKIEVDLTDGINVGIDVLAGLNNYEYLRGLESIKLLNAVFLNLDALLCLSIDLSLLTATDQIYNGPCALGNQPSLPVTLLDWSLRPLAGGIESRWRSSSEESADYYRLLHSTDGRNFSEVTRLPAAGYSRQIVTYRYHHAGAVAGTNYYRLEQYDLDGTRNELGLREFTGDDGAATALRMYPNPTRGGTTVRLSRPVDLEATAELRDPTGRPLARLTVAADGSLTLPANLAAGIYTLRFGDRTARLTLTN